MTRKPFVALAVLLGVIVLAIYGAQRWKSYRSSPAASTPAPIANMPTDGAGTNVAAPLTTPRGNVTIDARRQQLIGVRTAPVVRASLAQSVRAVGVVRYDETRQWDVNLRVDGWIRDLYVDSTGQAVEKGQPLFTLYSPDLMTTQQEYLLALKTRDDLQQSTVADARERADLLVASARQRLVLWELGPEDLRTLDEKRQISEAIVFRSPASGFIVEKPAVKGLHVAAGQTLYKIADVSTVWIEADVYESDVSGIRPGATAAVTIDAYPGERFSGRVTYVYPYFDEKTRTNKVRFAFENPRGRLKPGMFANVDVPVGGGMGLTVPTDALLDSGAEQLVFVAQGDGVFEPRKVKTGRRLGESIQILDGLKEGEQVAAGAAFFLDSESQLHASLHAYEAAPASGGATAQAGLGITLRTVPDPPKTGDNQLEATVKDAGGRPIDDGEVDVQFFLPAMPAMSMPAMRSEAKLAAAGGGVYRGTWQVLMAGRWDATVTVTRGGQRLGSKQLRVVAK